MVGLIVLSMYPSCSLSSMVAEQHDLRSSMPNLVKRGVVIYGAEPPLESEWSREGLGFGERSSFEGETSTALFAIRAVF